jgi:hypothetical protein
MADKGLPISATDVQKVRESVGEVVLNRLAEDLAALGDDPDAAARDTVKTWLMQDCSFWVLAHIREIVGINKFTWDIKDDAAADDTVSDDDIPF